MLERAEVRTGQNIEYGKLARSTYSLERVEVRTG